MTEGEKKAVMERAAIMEYDGGLDRQTAVLEAVALYFPIDYQNMLERVKAYPDGKTIIYEFLERVLTEPRFLEQIKLKYDKLNRNT